MHSARMEVDKHKNGLGGRVLGQVLLSVEYKEREVATSFLVRFLFTPLYAVNICPQTSTDMTCKVRSSTPPGETSLSKISLSYPPSSNPLNYGTPPISSRMGHARWRRSACFASPPLLGP